MISFDKVSGSSNLMGFFFLFLPLLSSSSSLRRPGSPPPAAAPLSAGAARSPPSALCAGTASSSPPPPAPAVPPSSAFWRPPSSALLTASSGGSCVILNSFKCRITLSNACLMPRTPPSSIGTPHLWHKWFSSSLPMSTSPFFRPTFSRSSGRRYSLAICSFAPWSKPSVLITVSRSLSTGFRRLSSLKEKMNKARLRSRGMPSKYRSVKVLFWE
mmetsp:Transcript_21236/g.73122  ORF Transcript_21236/g.73122 Transcript_21236/m.73122 type:complete len:215 (+) Transcript_21236:138-782(+)